MARARSALAVTALLLAAPSAASAATFCVGSPPGCVGTQKNTIQGALSDAATPGFPGRDLIIVAAGVRNEGFDDAIGNPVDIIGQGSGPGGTQLALPNTDFSAALREPSSTLQSMALSQGNALRHGVLMLGTGDRLAISGPGGDTIALRFEGSGGAIRNSTVTNNPTGAAVDVRPGADAVVEDSTLSGGMGVHALGGLTARRVRVAATHWGLLLRDATSSAEDVLISLTGSTNGFGADVEADSTRTALSASHLTLVSDGAGNDVAVRAADEPAFDTTFNLRDSIVSGFPTHVRREATNGGPTTINISHSDYDFSRVVDLSDPSSPGGINSSNNVDNVDPRFVDPAAGDYRLRSDSPLIDLGTPGGLAPGESPTDLDRAPRLVDGTGDCAVIRDMGAFEFQPPARDPIARASAPATAQAHEPVTFDAASSCDPDLGDTLSYAWTFDDGGSVGGQTVQHAFGRAGAHTGTVAVTDSTGRTATATVTVNVSDDTDPRARSLRMRPSTLVAANSGSSIAQRRRGARVSYVLSEPASVRFRVQRRRRGRGGRVRYRTLKGAFTHAGQAGGNRFRFTGRLRRRKLRPGRYRLVARPTDLSGNRGAAARRPFRVRRAR